MEKKQKRPATKLTPRLIEAVVRGFHDKQMTIPELADYHRIVYNTVKKILKEYKYGFWDIMPPTPLLPERPLAPRVTETRTNFTAQDKAQALTRDATTLVELTIQAMIELVRDYPGSVTAKELASFMSTAAPYAMKKKAETEKKEETKEVSSRDAFTHFKQQLEIKHTNGTKVDPAQRN